MNIVYAEKITSKQEHQLTIDVLKETFKEAIVLHSKLLSNHKKIAYFFIDPLLNSFEAANQFYFEIFDCEEIDKLNTYKSGASPIQALSDAKEIIKTGLYDAVFIFGFDPLLTNKKMYGKDEITKAMSIFDTHSIMQCYNQIAHLVCQELGVTKTEFRSYCDELYKNYLKTYQKLSDTIVPFERGRQLEENQADLFMLTDCANPNIDFSGGVIVASEDTTQFLETAKTERIRVSGVKYVSVKGSPEQIDSIVGENKSMFPHLRKAFVEAQSQAAIHVAKEYRNKNLYLEAYTCYPPIPIAFLLATGMIDTIDDLSDFLSRYEITITGGMNFARAPWNNPALNALIDMYQKLRQCDGSYGLVHGNGGIGEIQGIAILEKTKNENS
ncbi:hypothetical protein [Anaerobacillus alkaliphilus]|uniref:hypothetical protein n=1 Tax=Anaerobacillus alkaliphilus TaxID=1548597 RepID=UPI0019D55A33|nr:hypothetical protein [Anaerobacillus alkaliphilus]